MPDQWEYKVVTCRVGQYWDELYQLHLQYDGPAGWELVSILVWPPTESYGDVHVKAYLKRKVVPVVVGPINVDVH